MLLLLGLDVAMDLGLIGFGSLGVALLCADCWVWLVLVRLGLWFVWVSELLVCWICWLVWFYVGLV